VVATGWRSKSFIRRVSKQGSLFKTRAYANLSGILQVLTAPYNPSSAIVALRTWTIVVARRFVDQEWTVDAARVPWPIVYPLSSVMM
jgi:hypothetical protein